MRKPWLVGLSAMMLVIGGASVRVMAAPLPVAEGPACVASGKWKGTQKTPVLTSVDGRERMYGWLQWDRPARWTGRRCEANWWVFASLNGGKFKPLVARQDFLDEGQQPSLAVAEFSSNARWAAADVMTKTDGVTSHGYLSADLQEHTSCFGSAVRGLDGVRAELTHGHEPWRRDLVGVRDDGWLELSVRGRETVEAGAVSQPRPVFEPCSGKLKLEAAR